jgi:hypothetical protein
MVNFNPVSWKFHIIEGFAALLQLRGEARTLPKRFPPDLSGIEGTPTVEKSSKESNPLG